MLKYVKSKVGEHMKALLINTSMSDDFGSFDELEHLAISANYEVELKIVQNIKSINRSFFVGKGKINDIQQEINKYQIETLIFNNDLTPLQYRNLTDCFNIKILDRSSLILEIFELRAHSKEAKLQVEIAKLNYLLPRLALKEKNLEQQTGGGVHNRGKGEKQIDIDRFKIKNKISKINQELIKIEKQKEIERKNRQKSELPIVALVGYTNAGKSTLMNAFLTLYSESNENKKVLEKDELFATLDTSVRKITLEDNKKFLLVDTVGFISNLPHHLIKAFRSTLKEVLNADLILNVVDISQTEFLNQILITSNTLLEIGVKNKPLIYVFNKAEISSLYLENKIEKNEGIVFVSAKNLLNINELVKEIKKRLFTNYLKCKMFFSYDMGKDISYLNDNAKIIERKNTDAGVFLTLECNSKDYKKYLDHVWVDKN